MQGQVGETVKNQNHIIVSDFPGGAVEKNLPANAGDTGSIPGQESKVPQATRHLGPLTTATEPVLCNEKPLPEA